MKLRHYQNHAIDKLRESFKAGKRTPMLMLPTGAGKSLIATTIIKSIVSKGVGCLFLCDRVQLIEQTSETFDKHNLDHNIIQADHWRYRPKLKLHLASIQTLVNRPFPDVKYVFWDEAHCLNDKMVGLIKKYNNIKFIGISATPYTKNLGLIYDDLIRVETTKGLINQGFLCEYDVYGSEIDLDGLKTIAGDYEKKELSKRVTKVVGSVVDTWLKRGENRQTLCFAVNVAHSKAIVDEFIANGVPASHVDAHTKPEDRRQILKDYESGKIKILSNVGITTKGFDSPNSDCLILARPTKSLALYHQMFGRILRVSENGSRAIVLDHGNNVQRLGFPCDDNEVELCTGNKGDRTQNKKEELEREEKAPKPCTECGFMTHLVQCPECGHEIKFSPRVEMVRAELEKLEKAELSPSEKRNSVHGRDLKQAMWSAFLKIGNSKGHSSHLYKDYYGVWKKGFEDNLNLATTESIALAKKFKQAKQIAWSKSKNNTKQKSHKVSHDTPVDGYIYTKQTASNGMLQVKATLDGKYKFFATQTPEIMEVAV